MAPHPAAQPESWYSWFQSWSLSFNQFLNNVRYFGRGGLRTNRYWIWKERQAEAQGAIWNDPQGYYFCNIVAVSPEAQGKGVGRLLFEAVTKRADKEGVKCYLESSKSVPNVAIYKRMGFEMSKEMECRDGEDACMVSWSYFGDSGWFRNYFADLAFLVVLHGARSQAEWELIPRLLRLKLLW